MKYLKRFAIVLVVLFAVIGVFSLLKKPPKVTVPDEDLPYLEEVFGSSMKSGSESEGRLSGILSNTIEGVPSLRDDLSGLSTAPPSSLGASAPAYGDAPSFAVESEAPAFSAPFPSPVESTPAPLYGNPFEIAPIAAPSEPLPAPPVSLSPPSIQESAPPWPTPPTTPAVMHSDPVSVAPPYRDVSAITADTMPSSVLEPWGASGVTESNDWNGPATPRELAIQPSGQTPETVPPVSIPPAFDPNLLTPTAPHSPGTGVDRFSGEILLETTAESFSSTDVSSWDMAVAAPVSPAMASDAEVRPMFIPPKTKPLPRVPESPVPSVAQTTTSASPVTTHSTPLTAIPVDRSNPQPVVPDDYRPASIRNTMILAPTRRPSEDEIPKISFSPPPETPVEHPTSTMTATQTGPNEAFSIETLSTGLPTERPTEAIAAVPVEVIPFIPPKPEETISNPPTASPIISLVNQPAVATPPVASSTSTPRSRGISTEKTEAREHVLKFIEAQKRAAESGDSEKMKNAFIQLSRLYEHPELNDAERPLLTPILDRLALEIIFSCKNHSLEAPYTIQSGDSIRSVAAAYHLSEALLMKINGLTGARPLKPGTQLKVVLGQFDAKISVSRGELTLILGGLYAGRFPVSVGSRVADVRGEFVITSKSDSFKGKTLTLGNGVQLCGFDPDSSERAPDDVFGFSRRDANELFDILTERSVVSLED